MPLISGRHHPYKLYGGALLAAIAGLVTLCLLAFNQAFTPVDHVTVHIAKAGLQLLPGSDVKVRGIVVGSVDSITSDGDGAELRLRLQPKQAARLPANVSVRLVPKTLFGEKYVDLRLPDQPTGRLTDGSVIAEDRTKPALEIDQALNDLLPVLRTVSPVQLNHTLTALATALTGRGEQLGTTIEQLDGYLKDLDPHLPRLGHDLRALGDVTHTYAVAAPALLRTLGNLTVTAHTVVDEQQQLSRFLAGVTGAANQTRDLLARNAHDLVAVNRVSRPVLRLLARYSPEYPCFFRGYAGLVPRIHHAVGETAGIRHSAHVVVELVPSFPTYQSPIDLPEFNDKRGPHCYGLPHPPSSLPVIRYKDGTEDDPRFDGQGGTHTSAHPAARRSARSGPAGTGTGTGTAGLDTVLGPMLGLRSMSVPDVADLLWGPMLRGSAVALRTAPGHA